MEIVTIVLRIIHIFSGVFWVGAAWMGALFLQPTAAALGPDGGKFIGYMVSQRRYVVYVLIAAALTLLAGWTLFFLRYGIVGLQTPTGLVFALGGILGLVAGAIGGGVVGPSATKLTNLGGEIARAGKPPTPEQLAMLSSLQARLKSGGLWTAIVTALAVLMMAIARYV